LAAKLNTNQLTQDKFSNRLRMTGGLIKLKLSISKNNRSRPKNSRKSLEICGNRGKKVFSVNKIVLRRRAHEK
jgi:hypothetical protein